MDISPFEVFILKRKIGFLKQLANNEATQELLLSGNHESLENVLVYLDIDCRGDAGRNPEGYIDLIRRRCVAKLKEIEELERLIKKIESLSASNIC